MYGQYDQLWSESDALRARQSSLADQESLEGDGSKSARGAAEMADRSKAAAKQNKSGQ